MFIFIVRGSSKETIANVQKGVIGHGARRWTFWQPQMEVLQVGAEPLPNNISSSPPYAVVQSFWFRLPFTGARLIELRAETLMLEDGSLVVFGRYRLGIGTYR
jgi:hypothetical protein